MPNRIKSFLLTLSLITNIISYSQVQELHVGDTIDDIQINNILNYSSTSSKLSDFKGKLLIIDFWATWCSPCIASFAKTDSLQKEFRGQLQILPVTYEDQHIVKSFFERMSKIVGKTPVTVTNDNVLRFLFKHSTLPHYVWIDQNRKVIAVTEAQDVKRENISNYLKFGKFNYLLKEDQNRTIAKFPAFPPSVQVINGQDTILERLSDSSFLVHTILTHYIEGLSSGGSFRDSTYFLARNMPIAGLYKIALFGNSLNVINTSLIKGEIEDPNLYMKIFGEEINGTRLQSGLETLEWQRGNAYSYECSVPPILANQRFDIMRDELNRYFGMKFGIVGVKEKRKRKCLALVRTSKSGTLITKGGEPLVEYDKFHFKIRNMNIKAFKDRLALPLQNYPPIIDETNYFENVDLEINCNLSDLKALNLELKKFGLELNEKDAIIDTGVIKSIKPKSKN